MRFRKLYLKVTVLLVSIVGFMSVSFGELIGIAPVLEFPVLFVNDGTLIYDSPTGRLSIDTFPVAMRFSQTEPPRFVDPTGNPPFEKVSLHLQVNEAGALIGGVPGDDLIVEGEVDRDGDGSADFWGILLTGEVVEFGFEDSGGPTDEYDFRFMITGGALASLYAGMDIGVNVTSENSTLEADFTVSFSGNAKGILGSIPILCNGHLGDLVWHDMDRDGLQEAGEPGLEGIEVVLLDDVGAVLDTTVTGPDGFYAFTGLCAGTYTVQVDASPLPSDFVASDPQVGSDPTVDSNANPTVVILPTANSFDETIDFGFMTPGCTVNAGEFKFAKDIKIEWSLFNNGSDRVTVESIELTWPAGFGNLKEVKLSGDIFKTQVPPSSVALGPADWIGDLKNRQIKPGENKKLVFEFAQKFKQATQDEVAITVHFIEGCSVTFVPGAGPFECDKPIDELTMIWDGTQMIDVEAFKGSVGSTSLGIVANVAPGDEVTFSGFAGSPNDVYWELFDAISGVKLGESTFHLSCSDPGMNGQEDCLQPQGDGKDRAGFINDWLLEGIVDASGKLDCTP